MEWNVWREDFNSREIVKYNVCSHGGFMNSAKDAPHNDKRAFAEEVRQAAMYYFWSKSEHEIVLTSWPPYIDRAELERLKSIAQREEKRLRLDTRLTVRKKIDIYEQLNMNWDIFINYLWEHREEF